jgi:hypothetical protein
MPGIRTVEDSLRSEYVRLIPAMRRTSIAVETGVRHLLLDLTLDLHRYEQVIVKSRLKECESAIDALRRRQPFGLFDAARDTPYSLTSLPDLVGVRVLAFPQRRLEEARVALSPRLNEWVADHVLSSAGPEAGVIALKYSGRWNVDDPIRSEIQLVSLLVGLFWEVEHSAIYKPSPNLRGIEKSIEMKRKIVAVETALQEFESEFARLIEEAADTGPADTTFRRDD